jgi:hypothetical protein
MMDDASESSPRKETLDGNRFVLTVWSLSGAAEDRGGSGVNAMSLHCFNPQFFICSRVGDAALEADRGTSTRRFPQEMHIVVDALRVLSAAVPLSQILPGDRLALDRLQGLAQRMDQTRTGGNEAAALSTTEVDEFIGRLRRVRGADPESADEILRRICEEAVPVTAR